MPTRLPSLRRPPIGFAHRGARAHAPENTLEAFALAVRLGATGLESDVWLTRDGEAVLDHDGVVRQGLRRRPIADLDRAELPGPHPHPARSSTPQVGTDLELSLDVKDAAAFDRTVEVARAAGGGALAAALAVPPPLGAGRPPGGVCAERAAGRLDRSSAACPRVPSSGRPRWPALGIDAVNLHHTEWTGGLTALFHRFGVLCFGWDAQHDRILDGLLDAGIDAVYCDHVDRMVDALARAACDAHSVPTSPGGQTRTKARPDDAVDRDRAAVG